jgi:malonyl-CoA/methylmalonyl-CoA synthetase
MLANLLECWTCRPARASRCRPRNRVEALMLYLAVLRAGYVYLPLNTAYQASEIEYFIGNAEPAVVVCSGKQFRLGQQDRLPGRHAPTCSRWNDDRSGTLLERAAQHADAHEIRLQAHDELAAILYTSGTTGRSKGAMLTHGNLLSATRRR